MEDKRLRILSRAEINKLYGIPQFNKNEQASYFALDKKEYEMISERGSLASKDVDSKHVLMYHYNSTFY